MDAQAIILFITLGMAFVILLGFFLRELKIFLLIPAKGTKGFRKLRLKKEIRKQHKRLKKEAIKFSLEINMRNEEVRRRAGHEQSESKIRNLRSKIKK